MIITGAAPPVESSLVVVQALSRHTKPSGQTVLGCQPTKLKALLCGISYQLMKRCFILHSVLMTKNN